MDYALEAKNARLKVLDLVYKAKTSHIGSNFSAIDILTVLFDKIDLSKDIFVLSAGWKAASLYYFLWKKGRITEEALNSFCQEGSKFIGLAEPIVPEIKIAGGSMGLGLPGAVGLALSKKLKGEEGMVYVLMSDGELQCGTTLESFLVAKKHKLNNLIVIVDRNGLQAMGNLKDILPFHNFFDTMVSLGWRVLEGDGHDFKSIEEIWNTDWENPWSSDGISSREHNYTKSTPLIFVANTTKGKGVSFMENNNLFHYKQLSEEEYEAAKRELCP